LRVGGSNYMVGRCWYHFCYIVPLMVAAGLFPAVWKVPVHADAATAFHVGYAVVYFQTDLAVARWLCGPKFGHWSLPALTLPKLDPRPWVNLDGMSPGVPPLVRSCFEFNAALTHELFWNICFAENCVEHGLPELLALCTVPVASCVFHAVCSNVWTGIRCFPNFVLVALMYHASASIVPPMFAHAMWYFLDGKVCSVLKWFKHDWDIADRVEEKSTPPWDTTMFVGLALVLVFYVPLNVLVHYVPALKSSNGFSHAAGYKLGELPTHWVEQVMIALCLLQATALASTWTIARSGMDILADNGEYTTESIEVFRAATEKRAEELGFPTWRRRVHPDQPPCTQLGASENARSDEKHSATKAVVRAAARNPGP